MAAIGSCALLDARFTGDAADGPSAHSLVVATAVICKRLINHAIKLMFTRRREIPA